MVFPGNSVHCMVGLTLIIAIVLFLSLLEESVTTESVICAVKEKCESIFLKNSQYQNNLY